jgi:ATP-binding cassette subfamily B protein
MAFQRSEWLQFYSMLQKPKHQYFQYILGESLIRSIVPVVIAFVLKWTVDAAVSEDTDLLWKAFYAICGSTLVFAALSPWFVYRVKRTAKQTSMNVRTRLFEKIAFLSVPYFERNHSGELMSRMSRDVHLMEEMYTEHVRHFFHYLIVGIGSLIGMVILDWRFALALIVLTVIIGWINFLFIRPLRDISDLLQQRKGEANAKYSDLVYGLPVIKMYQLESIVAEQYDELNQEIRELTNTFGRRTAWLDAMNYLFSFISFGGIVITGAFLIMKGSIETGTLIALIQLQMNVTFVILVLGGLFAQMQTSATASSRVKDVLESEIEVERDSLQVDSPPDLSKTDVSFAAIEMEDVHFSYGSQAVLKGISFAVRQGETATIVGGSGNGKSTICKLLLGFYRPDLGNIRLAFLVHRDN